MEKTPINRKAADVHEPAANTAAVVTYSAVSDKRHVLHSIDFSCTGTIAAASSLKVEDVAGTTVWVVGIDVTAVGAFHIEFDPPLIAAAVNTALIVTLAALGAAGTGKLSCCHSLG
jgi:hypothetical protein